MYADSIVLPWCRGNGFGSFERLSIYFFTVCGFAFLAFPFFLALVSFAKRFTRNAVNVNRAFGGNKVPIAHR
jgi:hypothetical protein